MPYHYFPAQFYDISNLFTSSVCGIDLNQIRQARRKIHRGKTYKRYRGQGLSKKKYNARTK